jgi:hypothetical protein
MHEVVEMGDITKPPFTFFCHYLSQSVIKKVVEVIKYVDLGFGLD